eukprot:9483906-Pyramimonas_sp.AAC.1
MFWKSGWSRGALADRGLFLVGRARAPGLADHVQRVCWSRGRTCVTRGGGASLVYQTNDADLRLHARRGFIELQTDKMLQKVRRQGGGLVDLTKQENVDIMAEVMRDRELHLQACRGCKLTGAT